MGLSNRQLGGRFTSPSPTVVLSGPVSSRRPSLSADEAVVSLVDDYGLEPDDARLRVDKMLKNQPGDTRLNLMMVMMLGMEDKLRPASMPKEEDDL